MRLGPLFDVPFIICFEFLIYVFLFLLTANDDGLSGGGFLSSDSAVRRPARNHDGRHNTPSGVAY